MTSTEDTAPAPPARRRPRPHRGLLQSAAVLVALLAIALPMTLMSGTPAGPAPVAEPTLVTGSETMQAQGPAPDDVAPPVMEEPLLAGEEIEVPALEWTTVTELPTNPVPPTSLPAAPLVDSPAVGQEAPARAPARPDPRPGSQPADVLASRTVTAPAPPDPRPGPRPTDPLASRTVTAPAPAPVVTGVRPGTLGQLPRGGLTPGTPVVVVGRELNRAQQWTVGGRQVAVASASPTQVVLSVPLGQATGRVGWKAGIRTAEHSLDLGTVVPAMTTARPVVYGAGCPRPAATGLVYVGGRAGGEVTLTSGTGQREIGDRTLRNGSLLATVGNQIPGSVVTNRNGWLTNTPVGAEPVDVSQVSRLPRLTGERCPGSATTESIGLVRTGLNADLRAVARDNGRWKPFVRLADDAVAVFLPPGEGGIQKVRLLNNDGSRRAADLGIIRPENGAVTLLADLMVRSG